MGTLTFTIDDVLATQPCDRYDEETIRRLWGNLETATALDVLRSHLPAEDRLWLVFELGILDERQVYQFRAKVAFFAADIYERYYPDDRRVRECARAWQKAADGDASGLAAAGAVAWAAAGAAAWAAAWAAAGAAAGAAAWATAGAAAWATAGAVAWAAAGAAAGAAAEATAGAAAWAAAWAAAGATAWATAWAAMLGWLIEIVGNEAADA